MPTYLRGATIDYRWDDRPVSEQLTILQDIELDVADHTVVTLTETLAALSRATPSAPISVALRDQSLVDAYVEMRAGQIRTVTFEHVDADGARLVPGDAMADVTIDPGGKDELAEVLEFHGVDTTAMADGEAGATFPFPFVFRDEGDVHAFAEAIAEQRRTRADAVRTQVATDGGARFVVAFEGARVSVSAARCVPSSGEEADVARFRELWPLATEDLLPEGLLDDQVTLGVPEEIGAAILAYRLRGGSTSRLVETLWQRTRAKVARLDSGALARALDRFARAPRTRQVVSVAPAVKFEMRVEADRLGSKISPLVVYAYLEGGGAGETL